MSVKVAAKAIAALATIAISAYYSTKSNNIPTPASLYTPPAIVIQQPTCPFTLPIQRPRIATIPVVKVNDPTPELSLDSIVPNKTDDSPILSSPLPDVEQPSNLNVSVSAEIPQAIVLTAPPMNHWSAWNVICSIGLWALNLALVAVFVSLPHPYISSALQPIIEELFPIEFTVLSVLMITCAAGSSKIATRYIAKYRDALNTLSTTVQELQVQNSEQGQRITTLDHHLRGYRAQVAEQGTLLQAHRDHIHQQALVSEQLQTRISTAEREVQDEHAAHAQTQQELELSRNEVQRLESELATMLSEIQTTDAERAAAEHEASSARIQRDATASEWSGRFEKKKTAVIKLEKLNQTLSDDNIRLQEQFTKASNLLSEKIDALVRLRHTSAAQEAEIHRLEERNEQTLSQLTASREALTNLNVTLDNLKRDNAKLVDLVASKEDYVRSAEQAKAVALDDLDTAKCVMEGLHEQAMVAAQRQKELSLTSQGYLKDKEELAKYKERSDKLNADLRTEVERLAVSLAETEERLQTREKEHLVRVKEAEEQNDMALEALSREKERISTTTGQRILELEEENRKMKEDYITKLKDVEEELSLSRAVAGELERRSQDREREDIETMTNSLPSPPTTPPSSHNPELQKNSFQADTAHQSPSSLEVRSPSSMEQPLPSLSSSLLKVEIPARSTPASQGPRSALPRSAPSSFHARGIDASIHNPSNRTSPTTPSFSSGTRSRRSSHSGSDSSNRSVVVKPQVGGQTRSLSNDLGKHFNTPKRRGPQGDFNQHDRRA